MKKFKLLTILFATLCFAAMISCEGPVGPEGPAGANGTDGTNGTNGADGADGAAGVNGIDGENGLDGTNGQDAASNCLDCHNNTTEMIEKVMQYQESMHLLGTSYARGSSGSCAVCHASQGFSQMVAGETVTGADYPVPVGCRTCHQIHTTFTEADYALTIESDVTLLGDNTDGAVVSLGTGNLCANCHQSRSRGYDLVVDGVDFTVPGHFGPHHGPQTNVLVGNGLFEVPGTETYQNSYHMQVTDACVTCHLDNDNHTFLPSEDGCEVCHTDFGTDGEVGDFGDFDYRDTQTEIANLMDSLETILGTEHLYVDGHAHEDTTISHNRAGAMFNFAALVDDGSFGIHNTKYTEAILKNSIQVFAAK